MSDLSLRESMGLVRRNILYLDVDMILSENVVSEYVEKCKKTRQP